jgi:hypothetical protein
LAQEYPHTAQQLVGPRSIVQALIWSEPEEGEILNKPRERKVLGKRQQNVGRAVPLFNVGFADFSASRAIYRCHSE